MLRAPPPLSTPSCRSLLQAVQAELEMEPGQLGAGAAAGSMPAPAPAPPGPAVVVATPAPVAAPAPASAPVVGAPAAPAEEELDVPPEFRCPISLELMRDPVVLATGQSYDRGNIQRWFAAGALSCPKTGMRLTSATMVPNHSLKAAIHDWAAAAGLDHLLVAPAPEPEVALAPAAAQVEPEEGGTANRDPGPELDMAPVAPLLGILSRGSEAAQESAARVLATLADTDEMRAAIAGRGGLGLLVRLLQCGHEESAREAAAAALAVLAIAPDNKIAIAREQVRPAHRPASHPWHDSRPDDALMPFRCPSAQCKIGRAHV